MRSGENPRHQAGIAVVEPRERGIAVDALDDATPTPAPEATV
jgi:hypothetical protein